MSKATKKPTKKTAMPTPKKGGGGKGGKKC